MKALIVCAVIAAGLGLMSLSQATSGVGMLALACFFGILGRIVQAKSHHELTTWAIKLTSQRL